MSNTNERSVASAVSHPVSGGPITLRLSNKQQEMLSRLPGRQSTLVPLDLPQLTLTDEEREAIEQAIWRIEQHYPPGRAVVLRALLDRTT